MAVKFALQTLVQMQLYCRQSRHRNPVHRLRTLVTQHARGKSIGHANFRWHGRRAYLFKGTTVTMPDTQINQVEYPQPSRQRPGLGYPMVRVCTIFSLSCRAIGDIAIGDTPV